MFSQLAAWPYAQYYTVDITSHLSAAAVNNLIRGFDWPNEQPIAFYNVNGAEDRVGTSYKNLREVRLVAQLVQGVLNQNDFKSGFTVPPTPPPLQNRPMLDPRLVYVPASFSHHFSHQFLDPLFPAFF